MKKIAIIFSHAPYGKTLGQEGLNLALSMSCYTENIGIFFIGDGVFQILKYQQPNFILSKSYFISFKIFIANNINNFYLCYDSLLQRGLYKNVDYVLKLNICSFIKIRKKIKKFDFILNF
ncbi:sulfurtransferase complex subunit TusC [Buchnera aphidicola (Takecallis taiwana)]|uniref:sulfurtransferase complex subunit TusC n=1 Tax=Buchnera aphidicola TaxID=9 RepID=UPI0031B6AE01